MCVTALFFLLFLFFLFLFEKIFHGRFNCKDEFFFLKCFFNNFLNCFCFFTTGFLTAKKPQLKLLSPSVFFFKKNISNENFWRRKTFLLDFILFFLNPKLLYEGWISQFFLIWPKWFVFALTSHWGRK
jgi:hypothetical protein